MKHVHVMLPPLEVQNAMKYKQARKQIISTDKANMFAIKTVAGKREEKVKLTVGPGGMASCKFADGRVFVSDVPNLMLTDQMAGAAPVSRRQVMAKVMKRPATNTVIKRPATSEVKEDGNLSSNIHEIPGNSIGIHGAPVLHGFHGFASTITVHDVYST